MLNARAILDIYVVLRVQLPPSAAGKIIRELRRMAYEDLYIFMAFAIDHNRRHIIMSATPLVNLSSQLTANEDIFHDNAHEKFAIARMEDEWPRKATPEDFGQFATKKSRRDRRYKK